MKIKWTLLPLRTIKTPIYGTQTAINPFEENFEYKSVILLNDKLKYRKNPLQIAILPHLVN